jgi:enterochelin esterase-like enzyme
MEVDDIIAIGIIALCLCGSESAIEGGKIIHDKITSPSLKGNPLGNPATKPLTVYLPPGYDEHPKRRYPTVYLLHGAVRPDKPDLFSKASSLLILHDGAAAYVDNLVAQGKTEGLILVGVDGTTKVGCSYYTNSSVNGNYADYICHDIVRYVDRKYRTIPRRDGRAILGISAGGYGAMYLGMTHPDLFGAIVALSPGAILAPSAWMEEYMAQNPQPDDEHLDAMEVDVARALWPNPDNPPWFFDWPFTRDGRFLKEVNDRGNDKIPELLIPRYRESLKRTAIHLECGVNDGLLPVARLFHERLLQAGILHSYEEFEGGHTDKFPKRLQKALEFLSGVFKKSAQKGSAIK